ncbi:MAG TPA: hydroxymethylbilane synthase [Megamonas hypermegale]|nr:hydroxymethylbilane synthase [Megamonas hypermegale]
MRQKITIGTRSSKLALWQAEYVADCLRKQYPDIQVELLRITTKGDKILDVPLAKIGGKGLFTKELEVAMLNGDIDLAVHSLKDMPTALPKGLSLSAITKRFDFNDALVSPVYKTLENLPKGAKVGTSSLRRKAQILNVRPDLNICNLRGNVNTRLRKLEEEHFDAIVLAVAGLKRLGFGDKITQIIPAKICLPAVGQGALAIETRSDDDEIKQMLAFLHDDKTTDATTAERAFLARVEGGCQVPVGVYAQIDEDDKLVVEAVIGSLDGKTLIRDSLIGKRENASELGTKLAEIILQKGGLAIMQSLGLCCEK